MTLAFGILLGFVIGFLLGCLVCKTLYEKTLDIATKRIAESTETLREAREINKRSLEMYQKRIEEALVKATDTVQHAIDVFNKERDTKTNQKAQQFSDGLIGEGAEDDAEPDDFEAQKPVKQANVINEGKSFFA